ncbi:unnamed protein product [Prunus brigantina]
MAPTTGGLWCFTRENGGWGDGDGWGPRRVMCADLVVKKPFDPMDFVNIIHLVGQIANSLRQPPPMIFVFCFRVEKNRVNVKSFFYLSGLTRSD